MADQEIVSRKRARVLGLSKYFTGVPCGYGHIAHRYVCSYSCVQCVLDVSKSDKYKKYMKTWRNNNKDKMDEHARRSRINNRDAKILRDTTYRRDNPHKVKAGIRAWVKKNPDKIKIIGRAWRRRHPEKVAIKGREDAARRRAAGGIFKKGYISDLLVKQGGVCAESACRHSIAMLPSGLERKAHLDHIIPISRGGDSRPENLQFLCAYCNYSKGNKLPEEWAAYRGRS